MTKHDDPVSCGSADDVFNPGELRRRVVFAQNYGHCVNGDEMNNGSVDFADFVKVIPKPRQIPKRMSLSVLNLTNNTTTKMRSPPIGGAMRNAAATIEISRSLNFVTSSVGQGQGHSHYFDLIMGHRLPKIGGLISYITHLHTHKHAHAPSQKAKTLFKRFVKN